MQLSEEKKPLPLALEHITLFSQHLAWHKQESKGTMFSVNLRVLVSRVSKQRRERCCILKGKKRVNDFY